MKLTEIPERFHTLIFKLNLQYILQIAISISEIKLSNCNLQTHYFQQLSIKQALSFFNITGTGLAITLLRNNYIKVLI